MSKDAAPAEEGKKKKKLGKKGILIPVLVLVIGLGAGGFFFMGGSGGKAKKEGAQATTTTTAHPGKIIRLSPITLNLSDGHILKVGMALELSAKPKDKELAALAHAGGGGHGASGGGDEDSPMGGLEAKALDEAIRTLGDSTYSELSKPGSKLHFKEELTEKIEHIYHGDVVAVYFTDFVMS